MVEKSSSSIENWTRWDWAKYFAVIVIILAIGFFALNQFMGFVFKAHFLNSPCQLCLDMNHDFILSKKVEVFSNITSTAVNFIPVK